jgi:2,3-bisphosphoglycerate-dependent phosphoglycerate mutase
MAIEIVYETHSTTEDNEKGIATGWLPGRLSDAGTANAVMLGQRRRDDGLAAIFVSDLARAIETVEVAFAHGRFMAIGASTSICRTPAARAGAGQQIG